MRREIEEVIVSYNSIDAMSRLLELGLTDKECVDIGIFLAQYLIRANHKEASIKEIVNIISHNFLGIVCP